MDFVSSSDRATAACITLADIAEACAVPHQSLRRARVDPGKDSYRAPPDGWQAAIARLARERARELLSLAEQLDVAG